MSPCPGRIVNVLDVDLPRPRTALPHLFMGLRIAAIYAALGAIFVVALLSYLLFLGVVLFERRVIPWRFARRER